MKPFHSTLPDPEAEYIVRLAAAVERWVEKHPEEAHRLKCALWGAKYLINPPEPGGLLEQSMLTAFREEVRKKNPKWPSARAFVTEDR